MYSLLIKDITRLWPNDSVQTSNMQYALGVHEYGEVLYLKEPVKSFVGMFRKMKIPRMIIEGLQCGFGELY